MTKDIMSFLKNSSGSSNLPFGYHLTPEIVSLKNFEYFSLIKVKGVSHRTRDADEIFGWIEQLNTLSKSILSVEIDLVSYVIRREQSIYPDGEYDDYFSKTFNERYKHEFLNSKNSSLMVNDLYLGIVYKPYGSGVFSGVRKKGLNNKDIIESIQKKSIQELTEILGKICSSMDKYDCHICSVYEQVSDDGHVVAYSEPMEVMAYIYNGFPVRVPITKNRLSSSIVRSEIEFSVHGEVGVRTSVGEHEFIGMCGISEYADETWPGQIDLLLESDFPFVMTNSFVPVSKRTAISFLKNQKRFLIDSGDVGITQIDEIDQALDLVATDDFAMGYHHFSVMVSAKSVSEVKRRLIQISNDLEKHAVIVKPLTKALEAGFLAQFPSNRGFRVKPKPATSKNFWCFSSFHNFLTGKIEGNPWGSAVTAFRTDSKTPFSFNFHESPEGIDSLGDRPVGHTGIFGKTGSGKTTLLCMLITAAMKYKPNAVIFDLDRGMEVCIRAVGGTYNAVEWGKPTGWNPFKLEATPKNIYFLKEWLFDLAQSESKDRLSKVDKDEISLAVDALMESAPEFRNFTNLRAMLPSGDKNRVTVGSLLEPWITGDLKWIFNNSEDNLVLRKGIYGFDTSTFIDNARVRAPILKYLLFRGEELIDGTPFMYMFEECWKLTKDAFFIDLLQDKLKTIRKENGIVIFSTQQADDVLSSEIAHTFASSLATVICLKNEKANPAHYKTLGLTDVEIDIIRNIGDGEYKFLYKQSSYSAVATYDFSSFKNEEVQVFSGNEEKAIMVNDIIKSVGDDPQVWIPEYYNRIKRVKGLL